MEGTRSLLDQLEELVNEVIALSNRLACTTEDVRFAQSFHPQSVGVELAESRKTMLDLSARLAEVERSLGSSGETAAEPPARIPPAMGPHEAVSLRAASPEDGNAETPSVLIGRKWEEADARLSGLTQLIERALGAENASEAAKNLDDLALQYHRQKKFDEAERLYQHALAFREKFFGPDHASVATGLNNLAALLKEQGRSEEAAALLRRSPSITEKDPGPDRGPEYPETAPPQPNAAGSAPPQENFGDVELLFEQVLDVVEKQKQAAPPEIEASGPEQPETPEQSVSAQELAEEAKADVNPGTEPAYAAPNGTAERPVEPHGTEQIQEAAGREPAEAKVPDHPAASFMPWEPDPRPTPAMPDWTWNVAVVVVLSICALYIWKVTGRPAPVENPNDAAAKRSFDLMPAPELTPAPDLTPVPATSGILKLPDLLPGTRVRVDDVPYNLAPDGSFEAAVSEGDHQVELTRPGYEPKSLSVELKAGQTVTIRGKEVTVDSRITASNRNSQ